MKKTVVRYTNDLGRRKEMLISQPNERGAYGMSIWDLATGELCGSGDLTKQEIIDFAKHYGVAVDL